jgi:hypothetical protein
MGGIIVTDSGLENVRYVHRIVIGNTDAAGRQSDEQVREKMNMLNRCLTETPRGMILGIEKSVDVVNVGDQQAVIQSLIYHVGFLRKPLWISE